MNPAPDGPPPTWVRHAAAANGRGARLVARTLFKEMQRSGFSQQEILAVADELLGCLCASRKEAESWMSPPDDWEPDGTGD
jgi:hypothetical protein